jgi:hypothetical protein
MAELYVNVNGTWKQASNYYVNVNGTWKEGSELHAKVSSAWKQSGSTVYSGTSGIVTTNIVLDLNATLTNSYSGSGTTWTDLSGEGNNATLVNSPSYNSSHGGYFSFDGSNDHATLPAIDISGNEITFSIWTFAQSDTVAALIFFGDSTDTSGWTGRQLNVHLPYSNSYYFDKGHDGTTVDRMSGSLPNSDWQNNWVNWTFTANASTGSMKIYRNAELYASATGKTRTFNSANVDIRRIARFTNTYYDGYISKILLYTKELTASEVLQNYNATKSDYVDLITTNLVLHLDASNTSSYGGSGTTWSDISGNNNDLTLTNGPTFTTRDGGAIVFDGANDYAVSALNQAFFQFGTGDYSYGAWVKVDAQGTTGFESVLSSGPSSENGSWQLDQYYTNKFRHYLKDGSGGNNEISTTTLNNYTSDWFYLFVVNDRSEDELKFYVNGTLNATGSSANYGSTNVGNFSSATDVKNAFNVANNRDQNRYMDGTIAQVHVYKGKALSATEVLQNYNATKGNFLGNVITTNLVLHLDAGKSMSYSGSGTTWSDISGNNNDFTLTNSPTFDSDFGGMIVFDGSDDYASSANDVADFQWGTGAYSYGVWVNADTLTSSGANGFLAFYGDNGATTQKSSQIYVISGNLKHIILDGGTSYILNSSQTISTGTWYYIMFVNPNDGSTDGAKLYVNGLSVGSQTLSALDYGSTLRFARTPKTRGTAYLDGSVAQVHIYKGKALSASEVLQNYNATKDTYGYGTVSDPSGIIATGLDILLDAGNSNSYSGSGTTWTNLAPSSSPFSNATLSSATGTNTYSSSNSGYFDECRAFVPVTGSTYVTDGTTITYPTMTYSVWCYPDNLGNYQTLVDQGDDNWFFGFNGTALITYDPNATTGANTVANNNWYNLTMTHTQNDVIKFYKNGIKIKETTSTYNNAPTFSNWSFGGGNVTTSGANEGFKGYIATIAIYNRALSATEVLQNHNALKSRFGL